LVNGTWDVKNVDGKPERVKPADIKTSALLTVEGELDDISGSGQTEAAHGLCSGIAKTSRQHFEAKGAGHYGIFSGRRWREQVYPEVKAFIAAHQTAVKASPKALLAAPVKAAAPAVVTPTAVTTIAAPAAKEVAAVKAPVAQVSVAPAPVAQVPVVKTPVAQASFKAVTKVVPPKAAAKPAKAVTKPAPKVASKPLIAEKSQSKVKTSWVAAPKK
jgi:poly(3-hydroxybutyrate) depolymerase